MPIVQNPSIGAGAVALLSTTTLISKAQILTLNSAPVQLIPAPGPGKLIVVLSAVLVYKFGTQPYVQSDDSLFLVYEASENGVLGTNVVGLLTGSAGDFYQYQPGNTAENNSLLPGDDNQPVVLQSDASYNNGPIVTATLGAGGLGYAPNDTGTISTGSGDATYQVLTVGAGGAVLTFSITAPGTAYATGNGLATATGGAQPGVGLGFTVNITAVQTGDGTLKVVTYYQIIPVP